jgi:hypothetical protein
MACNLTQGRTLDACRNSTGGIEEVLIADFSNITIGTVAAGVVTAMTQAGATSFYKYSLEKENGSLVETHTGSLENGTNFYESALEFTTKNLTASESEELSLIDQSRLFIIVKTMSGKWWTMGAYFAADKLSGTSVTGAAFGDLSGYSYNFSSKESVRMLEVDSTVIAGLTIA